MTPQQLTNLRTFLKAISFALLLLNGVAALFGGGNLIMDPDGSSLSLSLSLLQYSPFHSFLIPGIILFVSNGVCSIVILVLIAFGIKKYSWYIMVQGAILAGWILIQVLMIRMVEGLHIFMAIVGIVLILCGAALLRIQRAMKEQNEYYIETPSIP